MNLTVFSAFHIFVMWDSFREHISMQHIYLRSLEDK